MQLLRLCLSFLKYIYYVFLKRCLFIKRKSLFRFSFVTLTNSYLFLIGANIFKTSINIKGFGNKVLLRNEIVNSLIIIHGKNNRIILSKGCKISDSTIIIRGNNCSFYMDQNSTFGGGRIVCMGDHNYIKIGQNCMLSDHIEIWATDSHPIYDSEGFIINRSKPITIGDNVWVGAHSIVLKGVNIGNGAIIGMASVVTKNISSNTINAGNPAQCIKTGIFSWKREFIKE